MLPAPHENPLTSAREIAVDQMMKRDFYSVSLADASHNLLEPHGKHPWRDERVRQVMGEWAGIRNIAGVKLTVERAKSVEQLMQESERRILDKLLPPMKDVVKYLHLSFEGKALVEQREKVKQELAKVLRSLQQAESSGNPKVPDFYQHLAELCKVVEEHAYQACTE